MRRGERQRFLVRAGHGTCTCEGAAFETIVNLEFELRFAMLLPPFCGAGLRAYDQQGDDFTGRLFLANDFIRVDADYGAGPYQEWAAGDWPRTCQSRAYANIFAAGIAFAPPHAISLPHTSPNGTLIAPAPPRTGMPPPAEIGKTAARGVADMIGGERLPPPRITPPPSAPPRKLGHRLHRSFMRALVIASHQAAMLEA